MPDHLCTSNRDKIEYRVWSAEGISANTGFGRGVAELLVKWTRRCTSQQEVLRTPPGVTSNAPKLQGRTHANRLCAEKGCGPFLQLATGDSLGDESDPRSTCPNNHQTKPPAAGRCSSEATVSVEIWHATSHRSVLIKPGSSICRLSEIGQTETNSARSTLLLLA